MIERLLKKAGLIFLLFSLAFLKTYSCDQTSINVLTAVDNGNGTFTYTAQICLGISPNWGATDNITIDANVPILNSGFTPSVSTTYAYCDVDLSFNGQNCASGNVMGFPPAGGTITNTTVTASGSVSGGNLSYNTSGSNMLAPGDVFAIAGDCGDCNNPNQLCFNITFTTTGAMTTVQLNDAEQSNNDCGGGACCPTEIDNSIPVPVSGCTPPTASFTSNSPECIGSSFNFSNTGTMTGVTWSWTFSGGTPASSTSQNPGAVTWSAGGTYTVTENVCLTAQPTCCSNYSQSIDVQAPPTLAGAGTPTTCGLCNGSTNLTGSGGATPYSYSWSSGPTTQNISSLCSGTYTVTVTDNNGCSATRTFTVAASTGPTCGFTVSGSACLSNNSFNFSNTGSMGGGVTYSWTFPSGTPSTSTAANPGPVTRASAGTYTITQNVIQSGCTATCTQPITILPTPVISVSPVNETCSGLCNGSATATGSGTTSPYSYSWSSGGTGATKTGLCAGTYTVTVTDGNGCTNTATFTINPGILVTSTFSSSANQCLSGNSFNFTNTGTSGGGATYSWVFSGGTPANSTSNNGTGVTWSSAGTYTITHTVIQSGCTSITTGTITIYAQPTLTITPTNPNCFGTCTGSLSAAGAGGTPGYNYTWSGGLGTGATKTSVCAGTYTVTITDANNCTGTSTVTLTAPPLLTVSATAGNATCNGTCNGTLSASGSGGTTGYTYTWSGGLGAGATKSGVCAGTYSVTITDSKGCTATASATVSQPPALSGTATATSASCNGTCNGTLTAAGSGGTTGYTYSWSGGLGTGATKSSVCAGTYTVTITDANGCVFSTSATVIQPPALTVSPTATNASCNGSCNGTLSASATGGTTGYSYSWSGGLGTGATKSGVCAGTFTVTVTDANGCTATGSATVNQPAVLSVTATSTPASCNGTCNGTLIAAGSGGTTGYTYSWNNGLGSGATKSSVCAGTYTVTITDANGCTATATTTVSAPTLLTVTAIPTPVSCNGTCNGALSASGSGGTTGYTYSWSGGLGSGPTKSGVCAGTYTVTVTDANGCTATNTATVNQPSVLSVTATATAASCNGSCNGTLTAAGAGGTSAYTYSWSGGLGSGSTKSGICSGTYTVTITDANGCIAATTASVTQPAALSVSATPTPASCNGTCSGTLSAAGSGGTTAYSYSWSGGLGAGASKSGVCAGSYTVTVTDANGCTATNTATITQPTAISLTPSSTNATCGNSNGTGTIVATGGTSPYNYLWCNVQTTSTSTGLAAGGCNVTVTDALGCTATSVATVNSVGGPTVTIPTSVNVSCAGGNTGSATANVAGGTSPYTYSWSPSGGTGISATGLAAGTYTINVTDNNTCIASATITITQPSPLLSSISSTANITCNGLCNGSATASGSGGTTNFTYLWPASSGSQTNATATGLCAGSFTVTITDAKGCTSPATATITQPVALTAAATASPASCNATCNGSINLNPSGGTTSYTFLWSNTATTEDLTALCAGSYNVTVTDGNGCTATASATVNQPTAITLSTTTTNSTCGNANGTATVTTSGGTTGYTYLWQNAQTTPTATGVAAGTYTVTVTDAAGCTATATATVNNSGAPSITASTTANVSCFAGNNGNASAIVTGGATPYTYLWAPSGGTGSNASGLSAGNYSVTVTDANGCTATSGTTITQPGVLGAVISASTNISCNGLCNGSATVSASGGTSPYSYFWQGGGTSSTKTGLCSGTFTVTVSDSNGCATTATTTISQPPVLAASAIGTNTTCNGICNGTANLTPSGGTSPYSYNWSNSATTEDLSSVCAGTFIVTVTDDKGCTANSTVTINQPPSISTTTSSINSTCGSSNGQACVSASGGTSPLSYSWNTVPAQTSACATGVAAGNYSVTVSDANGCTAMASVLVSNSSGGIASATVISNATGAGLCNGTASATMAGGTTPYSYLWDNGQTSSTSTGLCAGTVCVTVTDANGCSSVACVIITEPGAIILSTSVTNVSCNGFCNGSIDLTVSGGVSPYTYSWTSGATAQDPANLCAGTYSVTVTDNNGVTSSTTATISQPPVISISGTTTNLNCNNVCSGGINITASGGTSPYSYSWSNSSATEDISSLCAGNYSVVVTDSNSCTATSSFTVSQPPPIIFTTTSLNASCGNSNGSATVSPSGGSSPFTYLWSGGSTTPTQSNVAAGNYSVTVTDDSGCTAIATVSVSNNTSGTASATVINNVLCFGGSTGQASAAISGGFSPFTYLWSNGDTGTIADSLSPGNYSVSITDNNNCIATASVSITQPGIVDVSTGGIAASCFGICNGTLTAIASGGTSPFSYSWSGGVGIGANHTNVCAGIYTVTATDANGCTAIGTFNVNQPAAILPATTSVNSTCLQSNGQATVSVTGGTSPYSYLWNNTGNSTTPSISGIPAGTYTVSITDNAGCSVSATATVNDNAAPVASTSVSSAITCNGVCNGAAIVIVSGGTSPYSFLWSNGDSTTVADSLCAGTASVNITDATGCTASATIAFTQPSTLSPSSNSTAALCYGVCNGTMGGSASGGTSPYSFSWSGGLGTGSTISNVCPGAYSVTVTDANGCTAVSTSTVNQPPALSVIATGTDALCNGTCNGALSVAGSGGISPYSFLWDNGMGSGATINNVCTGPYSATVTDSSGCTASDTAFVSEPIVLKSFATAINATCSGLCNGSVADSATGGTLPYSFAWSGGLGTGANVNNVCAGVYSVTVTDGNGCTDINSATVSVPVALSNSTTSTNVACYGDCNGTAAVIVSGGSSPFTYLWNNSNFDTTSAVNSLCTGNYSVTITDANNCTTTGNTTVSQPAQLVLGNSSNGSTCNQSDGSASVTVISGGFSPYSYQWAANANNQTTATATGLPSGCYNVTVTNVNGCFATDNVCVSDLGAPTVSLLTKTNTTCFGSCNGFAQIAVSGGIPPYIYTWYDSGMNPIGQTTASAFNLCAGTFIGSMVDSSGCSGSISVTISQPSQVSGIISFTDSVSCFGNCDGQATITGTGGTPPYSFQWNDILSQTTPTATSLCAGTYNVMISDSNSCDTTISVSIGQPVPVSIAINTTSAFCGTPSGQACVTISNGVAPFTFSWSNNQTTQCAGNLLPGTYSVTITDQKGCTGGASGTVNNNSAGTATIANLVNDSCNNSCKGSATVSMSGSGTPPFTYQWSNGSNSVTATGLCAGTYSVTVTDSNSCASITTATITEPAPLSTAVSVTDVLCNGVCNGSATVTPSGGTSPYTYLWDDAFAQNTGTATGLCAGNYSVTITGSQNCIFVQNVAISQPTLMQLSPTVFNANCGQSNGNACIVISGGTSPYTYLWNNSQTNQCLNNVASGTYNISVTDSNGCQGMLGVIIMDLNGPVVSVLSSTNVTCNGSCNGSATISISGGAGSYNVAWYDNLGNSIFQTNPTASNLCSGTYSAAVTDSAGCVASASVTISQPGSITYSQNTINPTCAGGCSGIASVVVGGGTPPFNYLWNDPQNQTTPSATGLCPGGYVLTIADSNNCTVFVNYTLNNPASMNAITSTTNTSCSGVCNGSATVTAFNGAAPFLYQWDSGTGNQSTQQAINLCSGTYSVTITDNYNCTTTTTAIISQPATVNAVINISGNVNCNGGYTGFAQTTVSGGTPGYIFSWSDGQINQVASNLNAGIYVVTVSDMNGCSDTAQIIITQPQALGLVINKTNVTCNGNCDGTATLSVSGGTLPYSYQWSASTGFQNSITATGLCSGTHSVTVTDANGCTKTVNTTIFQPTPFGLNVNSITPTNCGQSNGGICISAVGGIAPYTYQWNDPFTQTTACASNLTAGCYYVNVVDAAGCSADSLVCINNIPSPTITLASVINVSCFGFSNGIITFNVTGGTTPYSALDWQNGVGNPIPSEAGQTYADSLSGGTYAIVVTDAAGCISTLTQSVTEPNPVVASILSSVQNNCYGQCSGQASASVAGGTPPYSYSWTGGQTSPGATGLCAGVYNLTISDNNNCQKTLNVSISQPDSIAISSVVSNATCNDSCNGSILINASGGTIPYYYSWSPNNSVNPSSYNLCTGNYLTTITDVNNCFATVNNSITEPLAISASFSNVDATCGSCNGQATVTVSGGTSSYTYLWYNGQNSPDATGLCAGTSPVSITDANGCTLNEMAIIANLGGPQNITISTTPISCTNAGDGSAFIDSVTGGNPPYSYLWFNGDTTAGVNSLSGGNYFVTVNDVNGCTFVQGVNIAEPLPVQALGSGGTTICYGQSTQIWTTGSGGTGSYVYQWSNPLFLGSGPHTVNPTDTTDYCFTVVDDNGCSAQGCITIFVKPELSLTLNSGIDTMDICFNDTINLCAMASGGNNPPFSYIWSNNFIQDSISVPSCQDVNPLINTNYIVVASDGCSLNDTDTVTVMVHKYPIASFVTSPDKGCPPLPVNFTSVDPDVPLATYSWDLDGDGIFGDDTAKFPQYLYTEPDTYTVSMIVTSEFGCSDTFSVNKYIIIYPFPVAGVDHSPEIGNLLNPEVDFVTDGLTTGATSWTWNFGDGQTGSGANPTHSYNDTGTYYVTLAVMNNEGCRDTIRDTVIIESEFAIFVPNAFTPNGNDKNEFFIARGVGIATDNFVMYIFDRWGDLIWETHDQYKGWDGTANEGSEMVQQDVYVWLLICYDLHGNRHRLIGHVTVVK